MWGKPDGLTYLNTGKANVKNARPVISQEGVFSTPPEDQYKKGALFLNTVRSVVDDDAKWFAMLHDFFQKFKYQNIMTEDVVAYFNAHTGMNLTPIFDQYLRHTGIPTLELKFDDAKGTVKYRWKADASGFAMPVRVGAAGKWEIVKGTTEWQTMKNGLKKSEFGVDEDFYYVNVEKE